MPTTARPSVAGSGTGTMSRPRKAPDVLEIEAIGVPIAALPESIAVNTLVGVVQKSRGAGAAKSTASPKAPLVVTPLAVKS